MASSFMVEVLTPEGQVFADEVEMVSTRTTIGSIGVLANHAPLLAILEPTELRLYKSESEIVRFAQGEGYLQVVDNRALVLVEEAIAPDDSTAAPSRRASRRPARPWSAPRRTPRSGPRGARVKRYEAFLQLGTASADAEGARALLSAPTSGGASAPRGRGRTGERPLLCGQTWLLPTTLPFKDRQSGLEVRRGRSDGRTWQASCVGHVRVSRSRSRPGLLRGGGGHRSTG